MASIVHKEPKSMIFKENAYSFSKIHGIGYNDFKQNNTSDFLTTNVWHALYYVQTGRGSFTIRNKTHELKAGLFYFITPNEPIKYHSDPNDPVRYYWFALHSDFAAEIQEILGFTDDRPTQAAKMPVKVEQLLDSLLEAKSATTETYFMAMSSLMQILSTEFSKVSVLNTSVRQEAFVENVKQLIALNYANPEFHIETASQMLYVSHAHMSRVFKQLTGMTPVSYLTEIRLHRAGELLQEKNYTVRELCSAVGFVDEWHFMKCFKKKYGITIGEFRKQHM